MDTSTDIKVIIEEYVYTGAVATTPDPVTVWPPDAALPFAFGNAGTMLQALMVPSHHKLLIYLPGAPAPEANATVIVWRKAPAPLPPYLLLPGGVDLGPAGSVVRATYDPDRGTVE